MLRCAPIDRPPPMRAASASGTISAAPSSAATTAMTNLFMTLLFEDVGILPQFPAAMQCDHPRGQIEIFDLLQAGLFQHFGKLALVGVSPDRFGEVSVRLRIPRNALPEPGQNVKRVPGVRLFKRLPDVRELEHQQPPAH